MVRILLYTLAVTTPSASEPHCVGQSTFVATAVCLESKFNQLVLVVRKGGELAPRCSRSLSARPPPVQIHAPRDT